MKDRREKKSYENPADRTASLQVADWCKLAKQGISIPVTTMLQGSSMEPLIRCRKDPVTIVPVNRELLPGDIVLFEREDGAYVVHRLYRISEEKQLVQTWGDNCCRPDKPVPVSAVLGMAVSFCRNGRVISLTTEEQRSYGIKWMNSRWKRPLWFAYRRCRSVMGRCRKKIRICAGRMKKMP